MDKIIRRITLVALIAVYFLIFVGSLVRASGSGMGCPDWPKCYDRWIPPTKSFVPDSKWYSQVFEERKEKNEKLSSYLFALGKTELALKVQSSKAAYEEEPVNITKTWIEYLNRLVGVVVGLCLLVLLAFSLFYVKHKPHWFILALLIFLVTGFQGWLGSLVVTTSLLPGMISMHMVLALSILVLLSLLYSLTLETLPSIKPASAVFIFMGGFLVLVFGQLILGLEVREHVDEALASSQARGQVLVTMGETFTLHRALSWLVLLFAVGMVFLFKRFHFYEGVFKKTIWWILLAVIGQFLIAVLFQYFRFPAWAQPFHLLFAAILVGMLFLCLFSLLRTLRPSSE